MPPKLTVRTRAGGAAPSSSAAAPPPKGAADATGHKATTATHSANTSAQSSGQKGASEKSTAASFATKGAKGEMDSCFDRLRQLDKGEIGPEELGPRGLQQLCTELGITVGSLEMMVLLWKLGAVRNGSLSRAEWLFAMYNSNVDSLFQLRGKAQEWVKLVRENEEAFAQMYNFLYDYVRGESERLMTPAAAVNAWAVLFPANKMAERWSGWVLSEYNRPISRDVWRQLRLFLKESNYDSFESNGRWPTAFDDFVAWVQAHP